MGRLQRLLRAGIVLLAVAGSGQPAAAANNELRIARGYGIHYLPLYVMQSLKLVEKHAAAAGLRGVKVTNRMLRRGESVDDAMLAGTLDIAASDAPRFLALWDQTVGLPQWAVRSLGAVGAGALWLMTRNPNVRSLADITDHDRIAVPGKSSSHVAVVLGMAAAQALGPQAHARLDPLTLDVPHPDALAAMLSGKTEINTHFAPPPFSYVESDTPGIHRVLNSVDALGRLTFVVAYSTSRFHDDNPLLARAFVAALGEATKYVAGHKREAARMYNDFAVLKAREADLMRMLDDPDIQYTIAPEGMMKYAEFMHRTGKIKHMPAAWKELFFSGIHDGPGS